MHKWHKEQATGDQIWSFETKMLALYAISTTSGQWIRLLLFDIFSKQCFNKCITSRLIFIAGDANAAAYKYHKKQEHKVLHDSSVAVMLREMQREVNTGHPFECRPHIDYSTNNHPTQLHAANYIDFLSGHPSMERASWTPNHEKTLEQSQIEESNLSWGRQPSELAETKRTPQIPWWHLNIMTLANPGESWNFKTVISGCDQQICPGTFQSSWPFVRNRSRTVVREHPKHGRPRRTRPKTSRNRRLTEAMMNEILPNGNHHLGHDNDLGILFLATLEFGRNAWAFWLTTISWLEQVGSNAWAFRMAIVGFLAVTVLMQWRMSTSPTRTFTRASITTNITSVCDGRPSFRHFGHLFCIVLFCCERLS